MNEKVVRRSLQQDRQLVFDLLDNLPLGVVALNVKFEPMFVNQTMAGLIGVSVKAFLKATVEELAAWYQPLEHGLLSGNMQEAIVSTTGVLRTVKGESIPVRLHAFPLYTKQKQIDGIIVLCSDMRQQLVWERYFDEYKHILDSINAGVIAIDINAVITTCNQRAADFWNTGPEQLVGRLLTDVQEEIGYNFHHLLQTLQNNEPVSIPELWWELDGKEYIFSLDCNPLKDSQGEIIGAVAVWRDISLQRLMELEANRAEKLALVGELAAGTAHEIRNPLTSIRGFVQLLQNRFSPEASEQDYLNIMLSELDRANEIIKNFLLLAKPQHPKLQFQDLNFILQKLVKFVEAQALLTEVQLVRNFCYDMPFMVMETESIKQVFLNLLQNAIQAMPNGGTLTVSSEFFPQENLSVVKISDTGVGIPKEIIKKIGHPFFTTRTNGTGLGLAVSYRIIENHKGKIEVISKENMGTTFIVKLPVS